MATLLTSDELEIQILFTESLPEVVAFVREVISDRSPLTLLTGGDSKAYVVNLANLRQFALDDHDADTDELDQSRVTVLLTMAEVKAAGCGGE
ncbi:MULTISPECIES: hypothetical protein [unclassified Gordonia (in: high G+C Gram-positive bacteria)]|uniref:hypothetical protein n=1 Tax=unclassified Gordonia (in: high G+C Gram-positive bacteria) TaxID=2657482 RepID=UPI001F0E8878|nr:hypothetical protein [Gordonia sp. ABSL49_1]MCH5641716.1 hypothetical protein [Gordonia sp. ABSL49_1]